MFRRNSAGSNKITLLYCPVDRNMRNRASGKRKRNEKERKGIVLYQFLLPVPTLSCIDTYLRLLHFPVRGFSFMSNHSLALSHSFSLLSLSSLIMYEQLVSLHHPALVASADLHPSFIRFIPTHPSLSLSLSLGPSERTAGEFIRQRSSADCHLSRTTALVG